METIYAIIIGRVLKFTIVAAGAGAVAHHFLHPPLWVSALISILAALALG